MSFTQSARTALFAFKQHRRLALSALGLEKKADSAGVNALPLHGPFLFAGKFLESLDQDLLMHKRASDIGRKLRPTSASGAVKLFAFPFCGDLETSTKVNKCLPHTAEEVSR